MDWNYIKSFLAIAETGSLELAAQKIRVSNTTVFRHIHALEEQAGTRLFDRIRGQYSLTDAGTEMLVPARQIMNSFDVIKTTISGADATPAGLVRITAPTSFSYFFLPDHLASFQDQWPDIQIDLLASNLEFNMTQRYADIAVRVAPNPPEHLVGKEIRALEWGIYGAADRYQPAKLDDLLAEPFIGASGTLASYAPYKWLDANRRTPHKQQTDDLIAMAHLVGAGCGLACLPSDLALPGLRLLAPLPEIPANKLWVLTHPDLRNISRIRETMRWIAKSLKDEPRLSPGKEL
ncbi:LysR family transcriptional regulator [Thalassospira sp. ER-Se-21-Dark]|uniref:LysR family transcriptional regulator n=1 Tax=Thalassospira sp. ER-Se-21-Dark TaxID=2585190 RepID=UPI001B30F405|nr:LysR family transcriptional regulator [Thalassospira sp. ER-Se-21-Dark]MBP3125979.1 LysR family transcriptional regulator [Thalassospira sp. ER-Se-21-Dark]